MFQGMAGMHRQVFDVGALQDGLLHVAMSSLNADHEVDKLRNGQLRTAVGLASRGFPANASGALWEQLPIGEQYEIRDPETGEWALRNVLAHLPPATPPMLQGMASFAPVTHRGIFWQSNNALYGVAGRLARRSRRRPTRRSAPGGYRRSSSSART